MFYHVLKPVCDCLGYLCEIISHSFAHKPNPELEKKVTNFFETNPKLLPKAASAMEKFLSANPDLQIVQPNLSQLKSYILKLIYDICLVSNTFRLTLRKNKKFCKLLNNTTEECNAETAFHLNRLIFESDAYAADLKPKAPCRLVSFQDGKRGEIPIPNQKVHFAMAKKMMQTCGFPECSETGGVKDGQVVGLKTCTGCKRIRYCSRKCQKKHWREHKEICSKISGN